MDGLPANQYPPAPAQVAKSNFLQSTGGKLILGGVIILLLLLTLIILNYFTATIPILPHRLVSQSSQKITNIVANPADSITNFLSTILVPSFAPSISNINLTPDKTNKENLVISWQTKDGTASGNILAINSSSTNINSISLAVPVKNASPSAEFARTIIPSIFSVSPKGNWACKNLYNTTVYCENFWEETGFRRGVGMVGPPSEVFFCQHTKDSPIYDWQSCIIDFSKTGVK